VNVLNSDKELKIQSYACVLSQRSTKS